MTPSEVAAKIAAEEEYQEGLLLYKHNRRVDALADPSLFSPQKLNMITNALAHCSVSWDGREFNRRGWFGDTAFRPERITGIHIDRDWTTVYVERIGALPIAKAPFLDEPGALYPATAWNVAAWVQALVLSRSRYCFVRSTNWRNFSVSSPYWGSHELGLPARRCCELAGPPRGGCPARR